MKPVIGWDIGGAHVKAVMLDSKGEIVRVSQQACALWKGLPLLEDAIQHILQSWQAATYDHAVTMTGELVDLFEDRQHGVRAIAETMQRYLPQAQIYRACERGASFTADVTGNESEVASMNWHASAQCLAILVSRPSMLVLDIGSTTSDITLCNQQYVSPSGWTDAERMARQSLFYTGVVRTPLMALGPTITWQGQVRHIAAEYFATTADVYRVLGELSSKYDLADTADGQGRSVKESMRRLARMVGHDFADSDEQTWLSLALAFKEQQLAVLMQAIQTILAQVPKPPLAILGLGAGGFLAQILADRLSIPYQSASELLPAAQASLKIDAEVCFPAYAVARLWQTWR
jgi:(4-(4-[2-(gamma-L-glutamylamino)ethyl]phenoxymethyl)furan-2-yl)methanamine synthase